MILTNCTDTGRGICLRSGIRLLAPREMWAVPDDQRDELRALFASETFQRFIDNDIFRLTGISDDEESTVVRTPEPPASLTDHPTVEGLALAVGPSTGSRASSPQVVEYQQGGPVEAETPAPPKKRSRKRA